MVRKLFLILLTAIVISCTCCYSPQYTARVLLWQDSDYDDWKKFKSVTIKKSSNPSPFKASSATKTSNAYKKLSKLTGQDFDQFLESKGTYSFLVIRNDSILLEKYFRNSDKSTLQNTFSISKSILSLAVLKATQVGYIKSLEDPITDYIPELMKRDPRFEKIMIKDLLKMKSGIKYSDKVSFPWINKDNPMTYYHPNLRKVAIHKTRIDHEPDSKFVYNNYNPLLLGIIMERTTQHSFSDFVETHIWSKIGTEYEAKWSTDEKGFEKLESGFMATPIDLAKIGRLILKKPFSEQPNNLRSRITKKI